MIVLYIVLAVIAFLDILLFVALLLPLSVRIVYQESFSVHAGVGFIKFKIFPKQKKKKKSKNKRITESKKQRIEAGHSHRSDDVKSAKKAEVETSSQNDGKSKKTSVKDTLTLVLDILKSFLSMLGNHAEIKIDSLCVFVSKPDAADTAVYFGICSGIVTTILALASNFGKSQINDKKVCVEPDFLTGKSKINADITLSARTGFILWAVIRGYLKSQSEKKNR